MYALNISSRFIPCQESHPICSHQNLTSRTRLNSDCQCQSIATVVTLPCNHLTSVQYLNHLTDDQKNVAASIPIINSPQTPFSTQKARVYIYTCIYSTIHVARPVMHRSPT